MGSQLDCTLRQQGKSFSGTALLESTEILFRGQHRCRIPFSAITSVDATAGDLHVHTKDAHVIFELGPHAAKWRDNIANPKSLLDKLGVKPATTVSLIGDFPSSFLASLQKHGAFVSRTPQPQSPSITLLLTNDTKTLAHLRSLAPFVPGAALWLVFPKGQKTITENDVRSAARKAGLVDIKVVSFSSTHTALKFVPPKSKV
jgi:hypothetical protein